MNTQSPTGLFLSRLAISGRRPLRSQLNTVANLLNWPNEDAENHPFHTLSYSQIESIKHHRLDDGKSPRTVNILIFALKSIVKTGYLMGQVTESHWRQVQAIKRLPVNPSSRGQALANHGIYQLLTHCQQDIRNIGKRDNCIITIFLSTGLRRFEMANLQLADIDLTKKVLIVRSGKGKKPRKQPLSNLAIKAIQQWLTVRGLSDGHMFNPIWRDVIKPTKGLSSSAIYQVVTSRIKTANNLSLSPHDLRRTFITELLKNKVDLITTSKLAGHANVTTTQIYDKRDESVMRDAVDLLDFNGGSDEG